MIEPAFLQQCAPTMKNPDSQQRADDGRRRGDGFRWHRVFLAGAVALVIDAPRAADEQPYPDAFEVCTSCHSYQQNEPLLEGPPLWGVVGRRVASVEGYEYSAALRAIGGNWDRARLDQFLTNPKTFAPGTKMEMGGLRNAAERADVLDFLETLGAQKPAGATGE
jgi:cytochrome c2